MKRWLLATLAVAAVVAIAAGLLVGVRPQPARAVVLNAVSIANGDWNDTATWDCDDDTAGTQACVGSNGPNAGYNVTIRHAVTIAANGNRSEVANKVTINGSKSLTFATGNNGQLTSKGNIIVKGALLGTQTNGAKTIKIRLDGVDESGFVGGGDTPLASDVGLWVINDGYIDLEGDDKVPWNRTCTDTSWNNGDELVEAPVQYGEGVQDETGDFATVSKGCTPDTVTFADGETWEQTYTAEVLNLTRNIQIWGKDSTHRSHVWIMSTHAQTLKYVDIRYMGPRQDLVGSDGIKETFVPGRYGLHFHKMDTVGTGAATTVVEGVVVRDSGSHAFVEHMSGGIHLTGDISYNTFEDAYWWDGPPDQSYPDPPDPTTDGTIITNSVAALVRAEPSYEGVRLAGFNLGAGFDNSITDSVAVGVQGTVDSGGFVWGETVSSWGGYNDGDPGPAVDCDPGPDTHTCDDTFGVWEFDGNVAHNNSGTGATVWQVNTNDHVITDFTAYENGLAGVFNGAYGNPYKWDGLHLFSNGGNSGTPLGPQTQFFAFMQSLDVLDGPNDETPWQLTNSVLDAGGHTDSAIVLASKGIIDATNNDPPNQPGEFLGNTMAGYEAEGVFYSFEYHDLTDLPTDGYETHFFFDDANAFDLHGSLPDFYFDPSDQPGTDPLVPTIDELSSIEYEGVGVLWRYDHSSGTLDTDCNCKVV